MMISLETLNLFGELIAQVQIRGGQPDFDEQAARISKARIELTDAIEEYK